jgi:hypothetical protein
MMRASLRIVILLVVFFGMLAVFAATGGPPAAEPAAGLTVTVEVFSGRPNPTFVLDDAAAVDRLRQTFTRMPAEPLDDERAAGFSHLGYRGIVIDNPRGLSGIPRHVQVLDGLVLVRDGAGGACRQFRDTESLEKRCLVLAAERGLIAELIAAGLVPDPSAM